MPRGNPSPKLAITGETEAHEAGRLLCECVAHISKTGASAGLPRADWIAKTLLAAAPQMP